MGGRLRRFTQIIFSGSFFNANSGSSFRAIQHTALLEDWRFWLRVVDEMEYISVLPAHDVDHMREKQFRNSINLSDGDGYQSAPFESRPNWVSFKW
jgi:hypothetical protein